MQKVYNDGSLGNKEKFNYEKMMELLKAPEVDHIRVFKDGKGRVGTIEITDAQIRARVDEVIGKDFQKAVSDELDKRQILKEFDIINKQQ